MEHAAHLIRLMCMLRPDQLTRNNNSICNNLSVGVQGDVLRRVRRVWYCLAGRRTFTTAPCVTTTPQATTTASGHVRGARPSSRGASKVRHTNLQYPRACEKNGGYNHRNLAKSLVTLFPIRFFWNYLRHLSESLVISQSPLLTEFRTDIHGAQTIDLSECSFSLTVLQHLLEVDHCGHSQIYV